ETLLYRPKPGQDNATPSGNGVAAFALQRLGHLLGESRYLDAAERALKLFFSMTRQQPAGSLTLLAALEEWLTPPSIVVLRGAARDVAQWSTALHDGYSPHTLVIAHPNGAAALPASLAKPESEAVNGWVCQGGHCLPAIAELASLQKASKAIKVI
ncbi:MAG TPA: thioredoxin domain-containing protein, partial [Betaproteobacteria bacterium]|nr:thioredoxin domain-containing protein [Betaproteobacteria bacterium]